MTGERLSPTLVTNPSWTSLGNLGGDACDTSFNDHHEGVCLGFSQGCSFCIAERARCRVCDKLTGGSAYCLRCEYKLDQIHSERIYNAAVARDITR